MSSSTSTFAIVLRHGLIVIAFNTLIGLGLAIRNEHPGMQMLYSQAIGLSIWAFAEAARLIAKRWPSPRWTDGWRRWALLAPSVPLGYVTGTWIGDMLCGCSTWQMVASNPRQLVGYLFISLTATGAICYFFYSRSRGQQMRQLVATAQRDAAEHQLKLIASQLEPHMLFNTLANLRVLIGMDPPRAQAMLDRLIAFLRATLSASRGMLHPLADEFARIDDYIALMKVRMADRLQSRTDLPAELRDLAVPTLLLQPLVENAIKHGLEPKVSSGELQVSARREGGHLVLEVRDTGVGVSSPDANGTHFGLTQARQRLATLYGDAASLSLDSRDGATFATVRIPLNRTA